MIFQVTTKFLFVYWVLVPLFLTTFSTPRHSLPIQLVVVIKKGDLSIEEAEALSQAQGRFLIDSTSLII